MIRIIPRLDIKGPNLVKGIHLEGLRVLGSPDEFARYYFENGADELIYMDSVASLYGRNSLLDMVARTSREIFIPLCVGGGLRNIADIREVLRAGADKVAINTAALHRPAFIEEASQAFGSSTIVVAIEAIRQSDGRYECFTDCGREPTGVDAIKWGIEAARLGAGELLVTSVDREGSGKGYDLELVRQIADSVPIPVIAHGGCGGTQDVVLAVNEAHADAVAIASMFHYGVTQRRTQTQAMELEEGNTEFLKRRPSINRIRVCEIAELKDVLQESGIECRMSKTSLSIAAL